jgi:formylglycine-generating enzyme required for sulfatase activity
MRRVRLSPFWMGRTEVTVGQFKAFVNRSGYRTEAESGSFCSTWTGPGTRDWDRTVGRYSFRSPGFPQDESHPVACVSWKDVMAFAQWLSRESGHTYRLPSEAEWEYACRGGGKPVPYGTHSGELNPRSANYGNNQKSTSPVRKYEPNLLGLYDMTGNLSEWTQDMHDKAAYRSGSQENPIQTSGVGHVVRGGNWSWTISLKCHQRSWEGGWSTSTVGFRLVRVP